MQYKKILLLLICALLFFPNVFATTISFAEFGPNRGLRAKALENFAKELALQSNGELKIQFFWGGSLLKTKSALKGIGDKVANMGSVVGFLTPKQLSLYTIGDLPLKNSDEWVGMRAMYELTQSLELKKEFKANNVVYISNYTTGPIQLICNKKLTNITNLNAKKIRASGAYAKVFAKLGASIQKLSQPNVYQALQTGLVDCNQNYYYSIKAYRQYEVAKNLIELEWGQNMSFGIVANREFFQKLSRTHQKLLEKLGLQFIDNFAKSMIENKQKIKKQLQTGIDNYKIEVSNISLAEKNILLNKGQDEIDNWIVKNGIKGKKLFNNYTKIINKYQKIKDNTGYPWTR